MGIPVIASMLLNGANPHTMTIITGAAEGKTNPDATKQALMKEGVAEEAIAALNLIPRDKVTASELPRTEMVVYATKPDKFEKVRKEAGAAIKEAPILLSIAAGLDTKALATLCPQAEIIRTMPNLTREVQGVYADGEVSQKAYGKAIQLLNGLGKPIRLSNENRAFNDFAVHSACGPALIAQFIARITKESKSPLDNQNIDAYFVCTHLRNLASGNKHVRVRAIGKEHHQFLKDKNLTLNERAIIANEVKGQIQQFYDEWLHMAEEDLGRIGGREILNATIIGTVDKLFKTKISSEAFANQVRSGKGMTNAGLLCMGSSVPEDDRFGTPQERQKQCRIAHYFNKKFSAEQSIVTALMASKSRGLGMAEEPDKPFYLAGEYKSFSAIKNAAEVALTPHSHSYKL